MNDLGYIYIIKNTQNKKVYIGQTKETAQSRFAEHLSAARRGLDYVIGKAIRKYGQEAFYVEVLEECKIEELNKREIYYISLYRSNNPKYGYNMSIGGNVTRQRKDISEKDVISLFNSGIPAYKIARIIKTDIPNITLILKQNNIIYGIDKQRINSDIESEICRLYKEGVGTMKICKIVSVSKYTVRRVLLRNNISLRSYEENKKSRRNLLTEKSAPRELCA